MPKRITPDTSEFHKELIKDVTDFLRQLEFRVDSAPYHKKMEQEITGVLQYMDDPTSLYLRGRADRIAVLEDPPLVFEWEAKTHENKDKHDMLLEALPLAFHVLKAQYGVKCLYVYRNPHRDHQVGFWVHEIPDIRVIIIPRNRWDENKRLWFRGIFRDCFPGIHTSEPLLRGCPGSYDPFAIIDESIVSTLLHWRELIDLEISNGPTARSARRG